MRLIDSLNNYIVSDQYRYYYSLLSDELKSAYDALLEGYMAHRGNIKVNASSVSDVWDVHHAICYDVPEMFFVKNVKASFDSRNMTVTVYPEYRFHRKDCVDILRRMEENTALFTQKIAMLSDREKVRLIHDHLVRRVTYRDLEAPYSHEAAGALVYDIAVCEGISKAFKYLADRSGLRSLVVLGDTHDDAVQPDGMGHAWNVVYVDSSPYHIDVTFDHSLSGTRLIRYDYFLLSDMQIRRDHTFGYAPICSNDNEYYDQTGHYADNRSRLIYLAQHELKPGSSLVVRLPDFDESIGMVVDNMLNIVSSAVPVLYGFRSTVSVTYNIHRMIFQFDMSPFHEIYHTEGLLQR